MLGVCLRQNNLFFIFDITKSEHNPVVAVFTMNQSHNWNAEVVVDTSLDIDPSIDTDLLAKIDTALVLLEESIQEEGELDCVPEPYCVVCCSKLQLMMIA